jgi:cation:H+ antiporter
MQFSSSSMIFNLVLFIIGFYILIKGSDWFVESASFIAKKYNISEIIIGLTIVSIGTSLPELATNIYASIMNQGAIALGNVVGSNIANICLVLSLGGIISGNILVKKKMIRRDAVIMLLTFILVFLLAMIGYSFQSGEGYFGRIDGIILLIVFLLYMFYLIKNSKDDESDESDNMQLSMSTVKAYVLLVAGIIMISLGAKLLVDNVVWCAIKFNIPRSVIAATVIAFGTSVPELAVTITGALKGKHDIALGNIVGSCFFNIAGILGLSIVLRPINVSPDMIYFIMPLMIISGILLLLLPGKTSSINRNKSFLLLFMYIIFIAYSTRHLF